MNRGLAAACLFGMAVAGFYAVQAPQAHAAQAAAAHGKRWYKGNTHAHTLNTDGDSTAADVVRWYRMRRYHFVVLTDHDLVTDVDALNSLYGAPPTVSGPRRPDVPSNPFLVIAGEEVTDKFSPREMGGEIVVGRDLERRELHVTAVNVHRPVVPQGGASVAQTLQRNVDEIRAASGFPIINHPNFAWSVSAADLAQLHGVKAFELWNGHMQTHNLGGAGRPGTEAIWDSVLSSGTLLYGVAADDAHTFADEGGTAQSMSLPGRAWIMVRAEELTAEAIVAALERGDFYASTGVELADYQVSVKAVAVAVKPVSRSKYDVYFIGWGGRVLQHVPVDPDLSGSGATGRLRIEAPPAVYDIRGDEGYVRARIVESNGNMAWTQPVMVPAR